MKNPFKSEKFIPIGVADLAVVAEDLKAHFKQRRYEVGCTQVSSGTWEVEITRGGVFKAAAGLKSAMKVQIEAAETGTVVRARVGIFGKQAIPTMVTMLVMWQVIFLQAAQMIREAKLDDEAVRVVEESLARHHRAAAVRGKADGRAGRTGGAGDADGARARPKDAADTTPKDAPAPGGSCTGCGASVDDSARFCPQCGQTQVARAARA